MKHLQSSPKPPAWQIERAAKLHRAFAFWHQRQLHGRALRRAIQRFTWKYQGKPFKSDCRHSWAASSGTLKHLFRQWRLRGQNPSALLLNYFGTARRIPAPVVERFVNFAAANQFKSCKAAWRAFCQLRGNAGPGKVRLGYDALVWNLPAGFWRKVKAAQQTKRLAEQTITLARMAAIVTVKNSLPAKLPSRRANYYQI